MDCHTLYSKKKSQERSNANLKCDADDAKEEREKLENLVSRWLNYNHFFTTNTQIVEMVLNSINEMRHRFRPNTFFVDNVLKSFLYLATTHLIRPSDQGFSLILKGLGFLNDKELK